MLLNVDGKEYGEAPSADVPVCLSNSVIACSGTDADACKAVWATEVSALGMWTEFPFLSSSGVADSLLP